MKSSISVSLFQSRKAFLIPNLSHYTTFKSSTSFERIGSFHRSLFTLPHHQSQPRFNNDFHSRMGTLQNIGFRNTQTTGRNTQTTGRNTQTTYYNYARNYHVNMAHTGNNGYDKIRLKNGAAAGTLLGIGFGFALLYLNRGKTIDALSNTVDDMKGVHEDDHDEDDGTLQNESKNIPTSSTSLSNYELALAIWKVCAPDWFLLISITFITILSAMVNIQTPLMIGKLVSIVQQSLQSTSNSTIPQMNSILSTSNTALREIALNLFILFSTGGFLAWIDIYLVTLLGERISIRIRRQLYTSLLHKPLAFHDTKMASELVDRLSQDVSEFKHALKQVLTSGLKAFIQSIGSIHALFTISPSLSLTLSTTLPFLYILMNAYGSFLQTVSKKTKEIESASISRAGECLGNIKTVKSFVSEEIEVEKYMEACISASQSALYLGFHIGVFQGLQNVSIGSMLLVCLGLGGQFVSRGEMTGGDLMSFMGAIQSSQKSLMVLGGLIGKTVKARTAASRVFEHVCIETDQFIDSLTLSLNDHQSRNGNRFGESDDDRLEVDCKGSIVFDRVSFSYPSRPDQRVLDGFSMTIPSGSVVAICGNSGSGKSTIGQLLEGFYTPLSGTISISGTDIRELSKKGVRRKVGLISQEPVLFATTIRENIRYGLRNASDEQVEKVAKEANCHEFIMDFPDGYDTVVGERGAMLSGGQKQRIAIARALIKSPEILILDEATSALDTASEAKVQQALDKSIQGRTVLVIAHRLSTIQKADYIMVLGNQGVLLECGTHQELLALGGAYCDLLNNN